MHAGNNNAGANALLCTLAITKVPNALLYTLAIITQVPGADTGSSPGVWNPENPLVAGLWIGCLFDLIITQSTYILMASFFVFLS